MERDSSHSTKKLKLLKAYSNLVINSTVSSKRLLKPQLKASKTEKEFSRKSKKSLTKKFKKNKSKRKICLMLKNKLRSKRNKLKLKEKFKLLRKPRERLENLKSKLREMNKEEEEISSWLLLGNNKSSKLLRFSKFLIARVSRKLEN
jgi:hypothetical protein